ncbi:MAG: hypothetical protein AB1714_18740 [Acidobacteriota bacterium]
MRVHLDDEEKELPGGTTVRNLLSSDERKRVDQGLLLIVDIHGNEPPLDAALSDGVRLFRRERV